MAASSPGTRPPLAAPTPHCLRRLILALAIGAALALVTAWYGRVDFIVELANLWALCGF